MARGVPCIGTVAEDTGADGWVVCGVCPEADSGIPKANRRTAAPETAGRAIEARICWYKRITVLSTGLDRKTFNTRIRKNRDPSTT